MTVTLLNEHNLEFLSLKGGCTGLSESTFVKMPHRWKSHAVAQMFKLVDKKLFTTLRQKVLFIWNYDCSVDLDLSLL